MLINTMNSYVDRRKKKNVESHVPIYDGGQKTHFFVFFFCFLAGAFHFFMTKSDPLRR